MNMLDILGVGDSALSMHVMDSRRKKEQLERCFKQAINLGYDPFDADVRLEIYNQIGIFPEQLTENDRDEIVKNISEYYYYNS